MTCHYPIVFHPKYCGELHIFPRGGSDLRIHRAVAGIFGRWQTGQKRFRKDTFCFRMIRLEKRVRIGIVMW